ncbi:unnamed protein product [Dovyalis caffra]|uniref:Uncharacterized protein n=1 Tax=Dovyalis caffra TaxID=77055 RepID=A0AAV1QLJ9_9ROSI|nr:unnamed protein product [Dovyalis caffra]
MVHVKEIKSDFPDFNLVSSMLEKSAARKLEERVDDVDATVESDVAADMVDQLDDISLILEIKGNVQSHQCLTVAEFKTQHKIADSIWFPELKETFQGQKQLAGTDSETQQQRSSLAGSFGPSRVMDSQFHVVGGLSGNGPNSSKGLSSDSDFNMSPTRDLSHVTLRRMKSGIVASSQDTTGFVLNKPKREVKVLNIRGSLEERDGEFSIDSMDSDIGRVNCRLMNSACATSNAPGKVRSDEVAHTLSVGAIIEVHEEVHRNEAAATSKKQID